jgi:hypothetical protein
MELQLSRSRGAINERSNAAIGDRGMHEGAKLLFAPNIYPDAMRWNYIYHKTSMCSDREVST